MNDRAAAELLDCPLGCAFLLLVERDAMPPAEAVQPRRAMALAATAIAALNPWEEAAADRRERALEQGARLRDLAAAIVAEPGCAWWWAPFDPEQQTWNASGWPRERIDVLPSVDPEPWEGYAERPVQWAMTSTRRDGTSSLEAVLALAPGEWTLDRPEQASARRVQVAKDIRVFEVHGPDGWHDLCRRYPGRYPETGSPAGEGLLTPHWFIAAEDWDAIYLSFGGLLTTPWVTRESDEGASCLWSWDIEGTMWLRDAVMLGDDVETEPVPEIAPLTLLDPGENGDEDGSAAPLGAST